MKARRAVLAACALWCGCPALARAESLRPIRVEVIDIAGGRAYLSAGSGKGLRPGTRVHFGKLERRVEQTSQSYAVVSARRLRVGAQGIAESTRNEGAVARLPAPRPLSAFSGQWPDAEPPARQQHPRSVPLGPIEARAANVRATLSTTGAALVPLEGNTDAVARAELRGRVQATPIESWPLGVSADVALQRWFGRYTTGIASGDPRPWLRVRELALSLGQIDGYRAQLGRVRYAASNLGPIDGGRFEAARWGSVQLAGFGGLLPNPIDGRFARDAGRFGAELSARGRQAYRPELAVVMQGSVFDGRLDERRLYARTQLWPGAHRLSAYAEGSLFDKHNPWQRPQADVTAAGADFDLRFASIRLGGRFDMRKPERSYWLQSYLPTTWLCASSSILDPTPTCKGDDDTRYVAQAYGTWDLTWLQLDAGGAWSSSSQRDLGHDLLGYATLRLPRLRGRYDLALGAQDEAGSLLLANAALRGDFAVSWLDQRVRLNLYYRPAYRRYQASLGGFWEQGAGFALQAAATARLSLDLQGDLRIGDVDALLLMLTMMYRLGL